MKNKTKLTNYNLNPLHKQVIISGKRKDGSKYKVKCDEGIKDLIKDLNKLNYRTLWSCQGDEKHVPYIVISGGYLTKRRLNQANKIIYKYFGNIGYFIKTSITCNGDVAWHIYSEKLFKIYFKHLKDTI